MPIYEYQNADGDVIEQHFPMGEAPETIEDPDHDPNSRCMPKIYTRIMSAHANMRRTWGLFRGRVK